MKALFLLILFSSCGNSVSESDLDQLCDGSDDLVLVVRQDGKGHDFHPNGFIYQENGLPFIHVNGKCEFWLGVVDTEHFTFNHLTPKRGKLTKPQGRDLLEILQFSSWEGLSGTEKYSLGAGGDSFIRLSSSDRNFGFSAQAIVGDELREGFRDGFYSAVKYLEGLGVPIASGNLRIHVLPGVVSSDPWWDDRYLPVFRVNWSSNIEVKQISDNQVPICFGGSFLVTGESADLLRAERARYRKEADPPFGGRMVLNRSGMTYEILIRDVLPYENENGLVLFDDEVEPEICWATE